MLKPQCRVAALDLAHCLHALGNCFLNATASGGPFDPQSVFDQTMSNATNEGMLRHPSGTTASPPAPTGGPQQQAFHETEHAKQEVAAAADRLKSQATDLKQSVGQEAAQASRQVRRSATEAAKRLREEGMAVFSRQRSAAAEELTHLRDALEAASEKLSEQDDHRIADLTQVAADRLDAVAEYLRERDLGTLASDLSQAARRRPVLFYGGLFAVGVAASRFFKASSHHEPSTAASQSFPQRGY